MNTRAWMILITSQVLKDPFLTMPYCNSCSCAISSGITCVDCTTDAPSNTALVSAPNTALVAASNKGMQELVWAFENATDHYRISRITKGVDGSMTLDINLSRVQCSWCKQWFPDQARKYKHNEELPSGCAVHKMCFPHSENVYHATKYVHDRCFVLKCPSHYRKEGDWKDSVVEQHVREAHW